MGGFSTFFVLILTLFSTLTHHVCTDSHPVKLSADSCCSDHDSEPSNACGDECPSPCCGSFYVVAPVVLEPSVFFTFVPQNRVLSFASHRLAVPKRPPIS